MTEQPEAPGSLIVQRNFYYAPEIGFYVRREERTGDGPVQEVELAGYTSAEPALPESALRLRVGGIQQALEREVSGEGASWHDPATGDAGDVLPVRTVRSSQYGWCRDFAERIRCGGARLRAAWHRLSQPLGHLGYRRADSGHERQQLTPALTATHPECGVASGARHQPTDPEISAEPAISPRRISCRRRATRPR